MCGIAGTTVASVFDRSVDAMLDGIRHRGPDDGGTWRGCGYSLGMRRLAIMDPGHAKQPMLTQDGRWVLVFNGEIYNFRRLREHLGPGVHFSTTSDTEVLLELIAQRGVVDALRGLEGMFAFAALDTHSQDLWLARDRFGEKPLYLDRREGRFAFCSELWPLLVAQAAPRPAVSPSGLMSILRFGHPWPGTTAVEGVTELLPAQWLCRAKDGTERLGTYWTPPDRVDEAAGSVERCGARLLELLDASVRDRLVADVPVGLFLSGGIDSGAVAGSAALVRGDIHAVTVGFDAGDYDETPLSRATASHVGLELTVERGTITPFSTNQFADLLIHYGQPFADTSAVPTRVVSRAARRHFKVVLSGDGGDELLAGYIAHTRQARLQMLRGPVPGLTAGVLERALPPFFPESIERAVGLVASTHQGLLPHAMAGVFSDRATAALVAGTAWERPTLAFLEQARESCRELTSKIADPCLALSLYQLRHSLPQDILTKVDRMSMAESLEVRSPFLDSTLASYALALPAHLKVHGQVGKWVLRTALEARLPAAVLRAPKRGFSLPVRKWLGAPFWWSLRDEVAAYSRAGANELNTAALTRRVSRDERRCRSKNDFRALHRAVLLYGFLRWRRMLAEARTCAG